MMMKPIQILGVVLFAVGVVFLVFSYHASNSPFDQLSNTLTGRFTNETKWYLTVGIAAAVAGAALALFGRRM